MFWNWGKISDFDLEIEVKWCYCFLLEVQEISENCLRVYDDVGKVMEGRVMLSKGFFDRWCFINFSKLDFDILEQMLGIIVLVVCLYEILIFF